MSGRQISNSKTVRSYGLATWYRVMAEGNPPDELARILAKGAAFHSPVVHAPQVGHHKAIAHLGAVDQGSRAPGGSQHFAYVREVCLEFTAMIDGIKVDGVDLIAFNLDWNIRGLKVMVRPFKAINKIWELMAAELRASAG